MIEWAKRHPVVAGAGIGLVWGAVMRAWMRYITGEPEFSWSGTLFILGASVIVGGTLGFARLRRSRGGAGWWRLSLLSLVLLGAGGSVMWPAVVPGAIAIGRPRPTWMRVGLGAGALATQIPVVTEIFGNWRLSTVQAVIAVIWYVPMLAIEAWAFSVVFAPQPAEAPMPGRVRRVLVAVPVVAVAGVAVLAGGIPGM